MTSVPAGKSHTSLEKPPLLLVSVCKMDWTPCPFSRSLQQSLPTKNTSEHGFLKARQARINLPRPFEVVRLLRQDLASGSGSSVTVVVGSLASLSGPRGSEPNGGPAPRVQWVCVKGSNGTGLKPRNLKGYPRKPVEFACWKWMHWPSNGMGSGESAENLALRGGVPRFPICLDLRKWPGRRLLINF